MRVENCEREQHVRDLRRLALEVGGVKAVQIAEGNEKYKRNSRVKGYKREGGAGAAEDGNDDNDNKEL